jgi:colicin import membrane protein
MTRLQKKCLIAAAGTHLLVVVVVLCSGFIKPRTQPDSPDVLTVIPANLVDAAVKSGVRGAQPPPPTPVVQPPEPTPEPPQPQPKPEPPKPDVQPPKPEIQPEDTRPAELPEPKPVKKHEIKPDLTKPDLTVVVRKVPKVTDNSAAEAKAEAEAEAAAEAKAAKAAKRLAAARARAFERAIGSIRDKASSATSVVMPGDSSVAYANYASVVVSIYNDAWRIPDSTTSDDAVVKISVTIARDGHVIESHIVDRCGDASVDNSVQRTLDRVREIRPFPDDSTDKERTYIINFDLKAKREMLG